MARNMYGATSADFTLTSGGRVIPGATMTIWSERTGGTQITDLLDRDSAAATTVTSGADGSVVYYGPNNDKTVHWADSGQGSRVAIRPTDITGDPPVLSIGTVGTGTAAASLTGTSEAPVLNLVLPSAGANGVNTAAIQDGAVTAAKIANDTITAAQIAANAVGSSELADNAVNVAALDADDLGNGLVLTADSGEPSGMKWSAYGIADLDIGTVDTGSPAAASMTGNPEDGYELNLTLPPVGDGSITNIAVNAAADIDRSKIAGTALTEATSETVRPEYHGAVGDGATDDLTAFLAAVATGKSLWLTAGTTYLLSGPLALAAGQSVYGNGATIKRADQVSTTTTTTITSGVTTAITVASVTGLKVGQRIIVVQSAPSDLDQTPRLITDITGLVVTVNSAFVPTSGNLSGTTDVYTAGNVISADDDCTVRDLTIDGNKTGFTFAWWASMSEISAYGDRILVDHCYLHDCPSEGITVSGGTSSRVQNTVVNSPDGNGIHFSGCDHPVVHACTVLNANGSGTVTGHADGCITWSNLITDATVSDCLMDGGIAGIGSLDSGIAAVDTDSDVTVTGCTIRNMTSYAIEATGGAVPADNVARMVFVGNRIYDSVEVLISTTLSPTMRIRDFVFSNNYVENTKVTIQATEGGIVSGNIFRTTDSDTRTQLVSYDNNALTVSSNQFLAPVRTAALLGTWTPGTTVSYGIKFSGNTITQHMQTSGDPLVNVTATTWTVSDNTIELPAGSANTAVLVSLARGSGVVSGNRINCGAISGYGIKTESTALSVTFVGNRVSNARYIGIFANAADATFTGNIVTNCGQAQTNNGGIGVNASNITLTGNRCYDDQGTKTQYFGVRVYAGDNLHFAGNIFDGNYSTGIKLDGTTPTNVNSVPYRKVAATVGATQTTVAHGLGYIPLSVAVTMTSAGTVWKSAASDATNIYLTADDADRTCDVLVG